jgi:3-hydroxyacyl-CoA dehydrogenase
MAIPPATRSVAIIGAGTMGAQNVVAVDNAMKWGYPWELGPFEAWDALGVHDAAERLTKEGRPVPKGVRDLPSVGKTASYEDSNAQPLQDSRSGARVEPGRGIPL